MINQKFRDIPSEIQDYVDIRHVENISFILLRSHEGIENALTDLVYEWLSDEFYHDTDEIKIISEENKIVIKIFTERSSDDVIYIMNESRYSIMNMYQNEYKKIYGERGFDELDCYIEIRVHNSISDAIIWQK